MKERERDVWSGAEAEVRVVEGKAASSDPTTSSPRIPKRPAPNKSETA